MNKKTPKRLVRLRKLTGLSRYRVSQDTAISYSTLTRIEKGQITRVNVLNLDALAKYYNVKIESLL